MKDLKQMTTEWRKHWGYENKSGFVIVFKEKVEGWCEKLCSPASWVAGCVAIDEAGNIWVAAGGDDYNGATEWINSTDITWESIRQCLVRFHQYNKGTEFRGLTENGLLVVAHHYDEDSRSHVTTEWVELDSIQPSLVSVAGISVYMH